MPHAHHLHWGAEALWQALEPLLPGLSIEVVASIGSTNTELLARVRGDERARAAGRRGDGSLPHRGESGGADGAPRAARRGADAQPCLLVAEHQTHGRGRQGKAWQSAPGASLTFSLALPMAPAGPEGFSGLSLAVGLALADALEPASAGAPALRPPRLRLKWPNDLLLRDPADPDAAGRKLGGILIETVAAPAGRLVVIGIGLNVQPLPPMADGAAPDGALPAAGIAHLQDLLPGADAPAVLARVAPPLVRALRAFERDGFAPLAARYAERDALRGRPVVTTLRELPAGVADGVDATGALWLRTPDGQRRSVGSGEVSVRPRGADGVQGVAAPEPFPPRDTRR